MLDHNDDDDDGDYDDFAYECPADHFPVWALGSLAGYLPCQTSLSGIIAHIDFQW